MTKVSPGEIVIIKSPIPGEKDTIGILVAVTQEQWNHGEGDYGFTEVAEVMSGNTSFVVPLVFLELFR